MCKVLQLVVNSSLRTSFLGLFLCLGDPLSLSPLLGDMVAWLTLAQGLLLTWRGICLSSVEMPVQSWYRHSSKPTWEQCVWPGTILLYWHRYDSLLLSLGAATQQRVLEADITSAYLRPMMESMGIKYRPKVSTGLVVWDTDTVGRWLVLAHIRGWYLPRDSKDCPLLLMKGWEWRIRLRWAMMSVEIRNCISYKYLAKDRMMLTLSFITHVLVLVWTRY
jgi:hypothetical protein